MKMKIVDGTEDVDGGGEGKNGKLQWFQQQENVAALDTAVDSDSPVPGGTPTPAIGYRGGWGQLFVVLWKGLGGDGDGNGCEEDARGGVVAGGGD
ncbi:hypothetical protein E3N88_25164 [Mikania micrantha]|uniref:Uncharacterized protein n=1 Tax=Mikania micrantha TaxID=192012 RepID=A0A5N6N5F5_9ASTR|nr:hypothetical protein E3N88_25164 [Mikania micrantha]